MQDATRQTDLAFILFLSIVEAQKSRLQQEKNSWRFGLNYLFETLKQHKEWYSRNQQYVQLNKDLKRAEAHVTSIRSLYVCEDLNRQENENN